MYSDNVWNGQKLKKCTYIVALLAPRFTFSFLKLRHRNIFIQYALIATAGVLLNVVLLFMRPKHTAKSLGTSYVPTRADTFWITITQSITNKRHKTAGRIC